MCTSTWFCLSKNIEANKKILCCNTIIINIVVVVVVVVVVVTLEKQTHIRLLLCCCFCYTMWTTYIFSHIIIPVQCTCWTIIIVTILFVRNFQQTNSKHQILLFSIFIRKKALNFVSSSFFLSITGGSDNVWYNSVQASLGNIFMNK